MPDLPLDRLLALAGGSERSLPDGRIEPTDSDAWQRFLVMLNKSSWRVEVEDHTSTGQLTLADLGFPNECTTIKVWPRNGGVQVNVFAGDFDSLLFDFDTSELVDQAAADTLADFVRRSAEATGGQVVLSVEGDWGKTIASYKPSSGAFVLG